MGNGERERALQCNEPNKQIIVDSSGNIDIVNNDTLISFTIIREATGDEWNFQCKEGMTWNDIANSEIYNPDGTILRGTGEIWSDHNCMYIKSTEDVDDYTIYDSTKGEYGDNVDPDDVIKPIQYICYGPND